MGTIVCGELRIWHVLCGLHVKTDWYSDDFAQASSPRLSENTRNSPPLLREVSPRRAGFACARVTLV